jgi:hypothetical protein
LNRHKSLWPLAAALALALALGAQGQDAAPAWKGKAIEYRLLNWRLEDTEACLRAATEDQVASVADMLTALSGEVSPRSNPALQAAIDARLAQRLSEAGKEGWDVVWVRESTSVLEGYVLPAPAVFLKRQ